MILVDRYAMFTSAEAGEFVECDQVEKRLKAGRDFLERVRKMTPEERFQTVVDAGIYTQDGRLTREYGGNA